MCILALAFRVYIAFNPADNSPDIQALAATVKQACMIMSAHRLQDQLGTVVAPASLPKTLLPAPANAQRALLPLQRRTAQRVPSANTSRMLPD